MSDSRNMDTRDIQEQLRKFAEERDWDQFHSPKNLSMALAGEAGELLEIFQWLTEQQSQRVSMSDETLQAISDELADIQIYTLRLADKLCISIEDAVSSKMKKNAERYTVDVSKGNAIKR
jgi:dCTP diphosphatase